MKVFSVSRFHAICFLLGYFEGLYRAEPNPAEPANPAAQEAFLGEYKRIIEEIAELGLSVTHQHISEEIQFLENNRASCGRIVESAEGVRDSLRREMKTIKAFRLSGDTQRYYEVADPFGEPVSAAFPSAAYDITESGNCLALSRSTACVFHCMGVLEHGLKALAAEFNVPTNHKAWGQIIDQIENGIKQIPRNPNKPTNWREHQQFCAEAAAQFRHFKSAWRDYAVHARVKYTEEEAEAIYRHVRDFMQQISKRLKEPQTP